MSYVSATDKAYKKKGQI